MKVLAGILIVLGLVIAIVPQYTNCDYGRSMTMSSSAATSAAGFGMSTSTSTSKPKCLWSARAELVVGIPLAVAGLFLFLARRKETKRALSVLAVLDGLFCILIPTAIIGICATTTMKCHTTMLPVLYVAGGLVIAVGLAALVWNELGEDRV